MKKTDNRIYIVGFIILGLTVFIIVMALRNYNTGTEFSYEIDDNYLKDYRINEVVPVSVNDETLAKKYLSEFVNIMIYHPEDAYDMLTRGCIKDEFSDYEEFYNYINVISTNKFMEARVKRYEFNESDSDKSVNIIDGDNNHYRFEIGDSIMDYKVYLYKTKE